jgi:hypothetical protein
MCHQLGEDTVSVIPPVGELDHSRPASGARHHDLPGIIDIRPVKDGHQPDAQDLVQHL